MGAYPWARAIDEGATLMGTVLGLESAAQDTDAIWHEILTYTIWKLHLD